MTTFVKTYSFGIINLWRQEILWEGQEKAKRVFNWKASYIACNFCWLYHRDSQREDVCMDKWHVHLRSRQCQIGQAVRAMQAGFSPSLPSPLNQKNQLVKRRHVGGLPKKLCKISFPQGQNIVVIQFLYPICIILSSPGRHVLREVDKNVTLTFLLKMNVLEIKLIKPLMPKRYFCTSI